MSSHLPEAPISLFEGVDRLVADTFGIIDIGHLSALQELDRNRPDTFNGTDLVTEMFLLISENWHRCLAARIVRRPPSPENWRWLPRADIDPDNSSPEVTLERAIVRAIKEGKKQKWSNQIPIASGLVARTPYIDLVHKRDEGAFDFVELKVGSNNPLSAAMQILKYGLVWLLSRQSQDVLGYNEKILIQASDVRLSVLAPAPYYGSRDLAWLVNGLTEGLRALGERNGGIRLSFAFEEFPKHFRWPNSKAKPEDILRALDCRSQR